MLSEWEGKKRWKYPTDRELALRSKLNVGWSIHTANIFMKNEDIQLHELEAIEKVIQRANDLERLEVERVGRMVCKLENMTRNALGDGQKTCSMCGIAFGLFRSSFVYCVDCGKAVCEKCRVDTFTSTLNICMLCKICSENREVWKKSGGWFYGKLPTMTKEYEKEIVCEISGSPSSVRAFDTWSHRAPDIVRLQSYEPPEENHNDHSQYISWTMSPTKDKTDGNSHVPRQEQNDHSHNSDYAVNSVSDIQCNESLDLLKEKRGDNIPNKSMQVNAIPDIQCNKSPELLKKKYDDDIKHNSLQANSIPDINSLNDKNTTHPFIQVEALRKHSLQQKQQDSNYLSVQNAKLSTSCPSLTDIQVPCKLRRKPSIRRKRTSAPIRQKLRD